MVIRPQGISSVEIKERSQVASARYRALTLARRQNFDEATRGRLALIVTEAAQNVLLHADGGEILLSASSTDCESWVDVLCLDRGPGISHLGRALAGGASTRNGLGEGLGAIRRLSDHFEIFSAPGAGTIISVRVSSPRPTAETRHPLQFGAVLRAKRGQIECGDGWGYRALDNGAGLVLVVDGLGHGPPARQAAAAAVDALAMARPQGVEDLLWTLHGALADTRGAAAACVHFDPQNESLDFAGLGNLGAALLIDGKRRGLTSLNGTLGHGSLVVQSFHYPWPEGALVLLHTDGISNRWRLDQYPGLSRRHPALIAGMVYRDYDLGRDDAAVMAVRRLETR